jgi:signal transduction histidine kinase
VVVSPLSFRTRILLLILAVGLVPLGLLGLWITRTVPASGERLLRGRLEDALETTVNHVSTRWVRQRSEILFLAEAAATYADVLRGEFRTEAKPPPDLLEVFSALDPTVAAATVKDASDRQVWSLDRRSLSGSGGLGTAALASDGLAPALALKFEIYERFSGDHLGTLDVAMQLEAILSPGELGPTTAGMVVAAFDRETGVSFLPLALDPALLRDDAFLWAGDRWLALRRTLDEPPLELVVAAPLTPILAPLEETARRSTWLLAVVAAGALLLASFITGRMTRSLATLSEAAAAVSKGDLERRVAETGKNEVGRLGRAFNRMTESLKKMLAELASRESLAAVGEFAASLAHEVRNPLTAIRIDLQMVEEGLAEDSELREPQQRALREVTRLDETVSRALSVARSGRIHARPIDLREPIQAASEAAVPTFESRGARLDIQVIDSAVPVSGDPAALEQLFLNLLRNSAESLGSAESATVSVSEEDGYAVVTIQDDGSGMPADVLERVFEPFFSTRPEGTGLGLPIARRIAAAHGGELELKSTPGVGTTATVRLPGLPPGLTFPM